MGAQQKQSFLTNGVVREVVLVFRMASLSRYRSVL